MSINKRPMSHTGHRIWNAVFVLLLIIILAHIRLIWVRVDEADKQVQNLVPTCCDDQDYQMLAVNLLYGKGFSTSMNVPFELYHFALDTDYSKDLKARYEQDGVQAPAYDFYRHPGFPIQLTFTYAIFGNNPLNARRMIGMQAVITALLIYFTGVALSRWPGVIAGGLTAVYFLNFQPGLIQPLGLSYGALMTETPTAFWIALFCFSFVLYLKSNQRLLYLLLSALALACAVFTRLNFLPTVLLLSLYLYWKHYPVRHIMLFAIVPIIPVIGWTVYASQAAGKFVPFSTQGDSLFAQSNNIEVIEGSIQNSPGDWAPGYTRDANGNIYSAHTNDPAPGESGWLKGLTFWRDNLSLLPKLFYIKLYAGFWNYYGFSINPLQPERFHLLGIGFLLAALGIRAPKRVRTKFTEAHSLLTVLAMLAILLIGGNHNPFPATILVWLVILACAWFVPYGNLIQLDFPAPIWFLAFVATHLVTTGIFYGLRFHWPLDPELMLFSLMGLVILVLIPLNQWQNSRYWPLGGLNTKHEEASPVSAD